MAIIINGRQEGLGMKEIEGRPLPLGVTISEDEVNFSVAVLLDSLNEEHTEDLRRQIGMFEECFRQF